MTATLLINQNEQLAMQALQVLITHGVRELCICPGSRNSPFVIALSKQEHLRQYFWYEERSAAFFAIGRSKATERPVAVITTSGTAAGELLPAAMEAYYTGIPLVLVTADRPRHFRGSGAPQTAEQVGLFGQYAQFSQDLAEDELCDLTGWSKKGPAHLNVCFDEPLNHPFTNVESLEFLSPPETKQAQSVTMQDYEEFNRHFTKIHYPFVVVSAISQTLTETVVQFLLKLKAPVYLEGVSNLREDSRLQSLRITCTDNIWNRADRANYPIDGIIRIGGVPTFRLWRDLEDKKAHIPVFSISELPFPGLSRSTVIHTDLLKLFNESPLNISYPYEEWIEQDQSYAEKLKALFLEEPEAEQSLVYQLSNKIPSNSVIYLGNSLPIREWDAYATSKNQGFNVFASRGLNGIDGQISTFLGMCAENVSNWGILGDLTTLYDMAAPWILSQLEAKSVNLVVVNNGGGKIFSRMFSLKSIQNPHQLSFKPLADMWGLHYEKYHHIPINLPQGRQLLEVVPDDEATVRFWKKLETL